MNWRRTVYQAITSFETIRRANMEKKEKAENPGPFLNQYGTERDVQPLLSDSPISDKFHQPSACLHQTRTFSFLNLRPRSRAMMIIIIILIKNLVFLYFSYVLFCIIIIMLYFLIYLCIYIYAIILIYTLSYILITWCVYIYFVFKYSIQFTGIYLFRMFCF